MGVYGETRGASSLSGYSGGCPRAPLRSLLVVILAGFLRRLLFVRLVPNVTAQHPSRCPRDDEGPLRVCRSMPGGACRNVLLCAASVGLTLVCPFKFFRWAAVCGLQKNSSVSNRIVGPLIPMTHETLAPSFLAGASLWRFGEVRQVDNGGVPRLFFWREMLMPAPHERARGSRAQRAQFSPWFLFLCEQFRFSTFLRSLGES